MGKTAIRFLTLCICTVVTAASLTAVTSAKTKMSSNRERTSTHTFIRQHEYVRNYRSRRWADWPTSAPSRSGDVCPGSGRSFDCKIWPPPYADDPDRKMSGTDGG